MFENRGAVGRADLEAEGQTIVAALGGRWHDGGGMCTCPAHDDARPSLSVRVGARSLLFKCFAGCDALDVIRAIRGGGLLARGRLPVSERAVDGARSDGRRRAAAIRLWGAARPVDRTAAGAYLASRHLAPPHPEARYLARTPLGPAREALFLPALLLAVRDAAGLVGVQRVFLDPARAAKRLMVNPRRALGRFGDGAVRLAPAGERLGLAEGYETARSAMALLGLPVWAVLGSERLALVAPPAGVRTILLLPDRGLGGRRGEAKARAGFLARGFAVETIWPPAGCGDWNDAIAPGRGGGRTAAGR